MKSLHGTPYHRANHVLRPYMVFHTGVVEGSDNNPIIQDGHNSRYKFLYSPKERSSGSDSDSPSSSNRNDKEVIHDKEVDGMAGRRKQKPQQQEE